MKDWVMGMEIEIEFPDYESVQSLTAQMAQTDWRWEYSVYNSGGDRAVVKLPESPCTNLLMTCGK